MSTLEKLPVTIITGFLGAGKTTLIRQLIQNPGGKRLAVVVNEFGDVGVDGEILKACTVPECPAENIVELTNGCICCTVADDLIPTVEGLMALEPRPDHILVETSGLALPKPLLKAFDWPAIRSRITVDGVLALADVEALATGRFAPDIAAVYRQRAADASFDHETPLSKAFEDQIACADIILLTKPDLVDKADLAKARATIVAKSPRPPLVVTVRKGAIDPAVVLGLRMEVETDLAARPSHHDGEVEHDHEDFESFVFDLPPQGDADGLAARIASAASEHGLLRVKGYAAIGDKPMRLLVQGVGARVRAQYDRPWRIDEVRQGRLVVIGWHDTLDPAAVRAAILG